MPALALLGGLPMPVAVGTSLLGIAMKSFAGLAGCLASVHVHWAAAVTAAAVAGSLAGGRLAGRIPETVLRKTFGWFVVVTGGFVLAQQLPANAILWTAAALPVVAVATLAVARFRRRATEHRTAAGPLTSSRCTSSTPAHPEALMISTPAPP